MTASPAATAAPPDTVPVSLKRVLVAVDASDHANRALAEAIRLIDADGVITGIHAYAARLHDRRFRQMEGGLPERYRHEEEMAYQRDVHDDLITRGLNIISDSYHDAADLACTAADRAYCRLSPEGKNYRRIVEAAQAGRFDVLVLGARGLGAVPGAGIGSVCERVVRRSPIDVLVVRDPGRAVGSGPIVACVDGSPKSYGALRTAIELARRTGAALHAVAAYDPHYHYVAFEKIAKGLSEEQGTVFRFREQEQLHEELIDDGIARIYQSHLNVVKDMVAKEGASVVTRLLEGKPFQAITAYLKEVRASLTVLGMTGVHADAGLDIGGCAENLLRTAPCHVWLGQTEFEPDQDVIAAETIAWSEEAEARLARAPEFVRGMARTAVLRHAQEKGHTFVTSDMVDEVAGRLMPGRTSEPSEPPPLNGEAQALLSGLADQAVAGSVRRRAEKAALREKAPLVTADHVRRFLGDAAPSATAPYPWTAAALARLAQVPEAVRGHVRQRVEALARERGLTEVSLEVCEEAFAVGRQAMHAAMSHGGHRE